MHFNCFLSLNRILTPILQNKCSYEVLNSKKRHYDHLRVFGSLCYASTLERGQTKFSPRSIPSIFISYPLV